jgi:hypothetical protein
MNGWIHPETETLFFPMQEIGIKFSIKFTVLRVAGSNFYSTRDNYPIIV